ncbi:MAG: sigma 54-interacting transcriptional regulator [Thiohalocapsa sp. PB-PSB1]|jgi:transcriptional regulator with GAF, ATPase, and Fis domain|nr:MAG: hypothetical protein N838_25370 [Thiohalocapsa sp. PB-PSB1]QQO55929.1 MAG: sigma 54-interacting transcriptional regulator [Thiohalocapsa sp. PB-PSB1]HCS90236.1 Fis family transcriptional regulator [Chromatiaceae bacterium]
MQDPDAFFREATLKLCSSLRLEDALWSCVGFLRTLMPVDKAFLQIFDLNLNAMRIIAIASAEMGVMLDRMTPLSAAAREEMWGFAEELRQRQGRHVWLFAENPCAQTLIREIAEFNALPMTSIMVMPLGLSTPFELVGRGSIVLTTEGDQRFTKEHADLLSMLKEPFAIAMSNALRHRETLKLRDRLAYDNLHLQRDLMRRSGNLIIGADNGLREVMHRVRHVAPTESPVLITGETGAGKDIIANAIHLGSPRHAGPFIAVNCGAIPKSLLDSELFGHEKGAFTGALSQKLGRFERAHKGTILLDEIGEMPLDAQVRLLRVLQHREIERLGGSHRIRVDSRILAATNRDLAAMVRAGQFRQDLFFRLNVFPIAVPPLRQRSCDIPALVQYFVDAKARELKLGDSPRLAEGAIEFLMTYHWPGNVRELENLIERSMILHRDQPLRFDDLGLPSPTNAGTSTQASPEDLRLDSFMRQHIRQALRIANGKIHGPGGAGQLLGVNPNTLRYKMKKLGIPFPGQGAQE